MPEHPSSLQQFQAIVREDTALQHELRRCPDRARFVTLVVERAKERSCAIAPTEVETALNAAAQAWMMRWIER